MSKEKELKDMTNEEFAEEITNDILKPLGFELKGKPYTKVEIKEGLEGAKEFLAKTPVFEVPFEICFTGDDSADPIETIAAVAILQSIQNLTPKGRGDFLKKMVVHNAAREAASDKDMTPDLKDLFLKKLQEGK